MCIKNTFETSEKNNAYVPRKKRFERTYEQVMVKNL